MEKKKGGKGAGAISIKNYSQSQKQAPFEKGRRSGNTSTEGFDR